MFSDNSPHKQVVSVTRLNRLARQILESEVGQVLVAGEISNFVAAASGHWYFTLKDNKAQVKTAMFKGANRYLKFKPKAGDKVVVRANLSIYEARGDYQLIAEHMEPEGQGDLKRQYELLKQQLSAKGIFLNEHKKPIPDTIMKVGIVTSSTGAAVHDILSVMQRRNPSIEVIIYPSLVQGESAAANIAKQIQLADKRKEVDVLIVGRGGGSLEDLWAFNEEQVAQAIFNCQLPIVSAVGHEVDVTIADYVADVRAPTPSAAAELLSKDQSHLDKQLIEIKRRLNYAVTNQFEKRQASLKQLGIALNNNHPIMRLQQASQSLDRLQTDLLKAMEEKLSSSATSYQHLNTRIKNCNPVSKISYHNELVLKLSHRLQHAHDSLINQKRSQLTNMAHVLNSVSPLATLSRGYSISLVNNKIVNHIHEVNEGDELVTKINDGELISKITLAKSTT